MTRLRRPSDVGVARERCRLYYCPGSDDFECVIPTHTALEPCCEQPDEHRHVPLGHCRHSPPQNLHVPPPAPGPYPYPEKVRIEFELPGRDLYAAWKDVASSAEAGWTPAECWLTYGETVPRTWDWMCHSWGYENLTTGVTVLIPAKASLGEVLTFKKLQVVLDDGHRWWDYGPDPEDDAAGT